MSRGLYNVYRYLVVFPTYTAILGSSECVGSPSFSAHSGRRYCFRAIVFRETRTWSTASESKAWYFGRGFGGGFGAKL
jgi:hypothetical protein